MRQGAMKMNACSSCRASQLILLFAAGAELRAGTELWTDGEMVRRPLKGTYSWR